MWTILYMRWWFQEQMLIPPLPLRSTSFLECWMTDLTFGHDGVVKTLKYLSFFLKHTFASIQYTSSLYRVFESYSKHTYTTFSDVMRSNCRLWFCILVYVDDFVIRYFALMGKGVAKLLACGSLEPVVPGSIKDAANWDFSITAEWRNITHIQPEAWTSTSLIE